MVKIRPVAFLPRGLRSTTDPPQADGNEQNHNAMARIGNHSLLSSPHFVPRPFGVQRYLIVDGGGCGEMERQADN